MSEQLNRKYWELKGWLRTPLVDFVFYHQPHCAGTEERCSGVLPSLHTDLNLAIAEAEREKAVRVQIVDPEHPHFPEHGELTGEVIRLVTGTQMAYMKLDSCRHGTNACYVSKGQVSAELVMRPRRKGSGKK